MFRKLMKLAALAIYLGAMAPMLGAGLPQPLPPLPTTYKGKVFIEGQPAPSGLQIVACVNGCNSFQSGPSITREPERTAQYITLAVAAATSLYGKTITFHIITEFGTIQAEETDLYKKGAASLTLNLHFPALPQAPTPTPTPTPTVTPTPTPTPSLPIPGDPVVPRLATGVLVGGVAALIAGIVLLLWIRRRRAF